MIIEKHKPQLHEVEQKEDTIVKPVSKEEEMVKTNAIAEAYKAVRKILESIPSDLDDPNSPPLFKTIKMDNGQLNRVKLDKWNQEYGIAFPAVFIHFIDVYYNQGAARISEGKGVMRIHYVLNRLNNSDDGEDGELEGLMVYQRIVAAIESNKTQFPALVSRFQLQYWDQPLSFDDGLQPYWIDYQIWFSDYTAYRYKDYVDAYIVQPPFTNHSDQNEIANPDNLPDDKSVTYEESSTLQV
jgi:hypothetical protein